MGFRIIATRGTKRYLDEHGVACRSGSTRCWRAGPHIVDAIKNGEVQIVFNTTEGATGAGRQPFAPARGPLA